jgi:trehalose 6-phosphate phosphatase
MTHHLDLGDLEGFRLKDGDALFVDFDGTLAEIGLDPAAIRLEHRAAAALEALAARLGGAVAVLSGRDVRDLVERMPAAVWRAGGHGLEVVEPGGAAPSRPTPPPEAVLARLRRMADSHAGVRLELKGPVVALHYRAAPEAETACLDAARTAARAVEHHVFQKGKMVVEVKPAAANKGAALRSIASRGPFSGRRPVMLGDDATDEDAILEAIALGGIGIKIGEGESAAGLRTPDPAAVRAWLAREAGI